jgi:tRNA pseudouridine55 synthase
MDGVIVVDKPSGWTSHDVVNKVRRFVDTKRVGHLGTLDPMATGVLPLVVGRATRLSQFYAKSDKIYDAVIHFGYSTNTYDSEGKPVSEEQPYVCEAAAIERLLNAFRGPITQMPPPISAKKVSGTPAYKLARKNLPVELKPVEVNVYSLELLECAGNEIRVRAHCSAGTYLRGIAHELGQAAGCGAFLKKLVRLACGDFTLEQAATLERLQELSTEGRMTEAIIPAAHLLPQFPNETVDAITAGQIRQGRDFRVSPFRVGKGTRFVKAVSQEGVLLAIGEARLPNVYHPILVL